jgi:hypothetical protein
MWPGIWPPTATRPPHDEGRATPDPADTNSTTDPTKTSSTTYQGGSTMTQFNRSGTDKGMDRRCPQWWAVFDVLHGIDTYQVQCDDVMQNEWRCFCRSWIYGGHVTCKHIEQVMRHACLASANHPAGPNDLASAGITITNKPHYVPRYGNGKPASVATSQRCACGELMRQPQLRMDAAGNQIIQLEYAGRKYLFAWAVEPKRCGDRLPVSVLPPRLREYYDTPEQTVVVVALGTDLDGELSVIGEPLSTA